MAAALVALFTWSLFAANLCLASGTGIECGWQPMPDGSPSYECILQVEPELLNSLRRGDSIPLSVEVPDHVRPIRRIRLVAGEGTLPQHTLATNLKPWPGIEKESREGVVETQFTTSNNGDRYSYQQATNGAVVPLNGSMANAEEAFNRALQNGGQAVRDAVGQVTQDVLPPDPGRGVASAIDQAGQELGNNLRNASETVRDDIRQMFGGPTASGDGSEILPPGEGNARPTNGQAVQQILPGNADTAGNSRRRLDQSININSANDWQSSRTATTTNPIAPPNQFSSQRQDGAAKSQTQVANDANAGSVVDERYGNLPPLSGNNSAILPQHTHGADAGRADFYGNGSPSIGHLPIADNRNGTTSGNSSTSGGPSFPPFNATAGNNQSPITPTPMTSSSTPEIRREMLNQPANAEIQGANGMPIGQQPINPAQLASQGTAPQGAPAANDFGWDTKPQSQLNAPPSGVASNNVFPLLLSWVLLSGSGAGNLYLFWSYLDVRNKYRDLVDDASRRISGRRIRD